MYCGSSKPNDSPILPFNHPILLWSVGNSELSLDALTSTEVNKLPESILTPIVRPQYFDLFPYLIFYQSLKFSETLENLTLGLKKENPGLPGEVIYENNIILITPQGNM